MDHKKNLISLGVFILSLGGILDVAHAEDNTAVSVTPTVTTSSISSQSNANPPTPTSSAATSQNANSNSQSNPAVSNKSTSTNSPSSEMSFYDKLRQLAYNGQSAKAIILAQEYLKVKDNSEIRTLLGRMLGWNGNYDEARQQLNIVLSKGPNADASEALAAVEIWAGNYQRAVDIADEALKYKPSSSELLQVKQKALAKLQSQTTTATTLPATTGTSTTATSNATQNVAAGAVTPQSTAPTTQATGAAATPAQQSFYQKLRQLAFSGQRNKAIQLAQEYLKTEDDDEVRVLLGNMLMWNGDYNGARQQLQQVLKKGPDTDASEALAYVELRSNNYQQALNVVNAGLKNKPDDKVLQDQKKAALIGLKFGPNFYQNLRKTAFVPGQRNKAIQQAKQYLAVTDDSEVRTFLGQMLTWNGDYNGARQQLQQVLKNGPDSDASVALAREEMYAGNYKGALNIIDVALRNKPNDSELLQAKQQILSAIRSGAITKARVGEQGPQGPVQLTASTQTTTYNEFGMESWETSVPDVHWSWWNYSSVYYTRSTPIGSFTGQVNFQNRFSTDSSYQYDFIGYPHLFPGAYAYIEYAHSSFNTVFPLNFYGYEPFFSLPHGWEFSVGGRTLQFSSYTQIWTGSIAKYIGNYWVSFRPYVTPSSTGTSKSYFGNVRRYFSDPLNYMGVQAGTGTGPAVNFLDLTPDNRNSLSSIKSDSVEVYGQVPFFNDHLYFKYSAEWAYEFYQTSGQRRYWTIGGGLAVPF